MQLVCCPARRGCSRKFCTAGLRTMLAVQFRTTGTRTMLAGECPLIGAPISEWASRLEDGASPLRIAAMPSRFSFARSSTYRKGSPGYRRAFSAYVNSLYMRHADDARVSSAQPACGRCSRGSAPSSAPGGASRTEPPLRIAAMPSRFSFASSSTYRKGSPTLPESLFCYLYAVGATACGRCARKFRRTGSRTMLAGECPLCGAGAP